MPLDTRDTLVAVRPDIWQALKSEGIPVTKYPNTQNRNLALVPNWVRMLFVGIRIDANQRRRKDSDVVAARFCGIAWRNPDIRDAVEALIGLDLDSEENTDLVWNYVKATLAAHKK